MFRVHVGVHEVVHEDHVQHRPQSHVAQVHARLVVRPQELPHRHPSMYVSTSTLDVDLKGSGKVTFK